MFFFRLNKITIFDNREGKGLFFFGRSRAEVKIMSFVATEFIHMPDLSALQETVDPVVQKKLLEQAVAAVIDSRILTTVQNVRDNQKLTFGDSGFVVYKSDKIPEHFDWLLLVLEEDKDVREGAALVQHIVNHREFGNFTNQLITSLGAAANPMVMAAVQIAKFAVNVITEKGKKNKDDQIGLLYMSLNRKEHYPFGERKRDDVPDLTQNMLVDYSLFGVEDDGGQPPPSQPDTPKKDTKKKSGPKKETSTTAASTGAKKPARKPKPKKQTPVG